jgi:hypothetical protein
MAYGAASMALAGLQREGWGSAKGSRIDLNSV